MKQHAHLRKKIAAGIVLMMLLLQSMGLSVFAAGTGTATIGITNPVEDSTYSVYQVLTASVAGQDNDGNNLFNYTVNDNFKDFFKDNADYALNAQNEIVIMPSGKVVPTDKEWLNTNATEAAALASALQRYAVDNKKAPSATLDKNSATAPLPIGFYVLAETASADGGKEVATKPILVDLTSDKTNIQLKKDTTDLEKKIVEGTERVDSNNVNIGDAVNYEITTSIPTYEANVDKDSLYFVLTDTFSAGLTYNEDLAIAGFTAGTDYTATLNGQVLTIEFTKDAIFNNQGKAVVATYSATLNDKAVVDSTDGNPNTVKLEYTNNTNESEKHNTLEDETKTYTYGFGLHKVDKVEQSVGLKDAVFTVKDADGNTVYFIDDGNGTYTVTTADTEGATNEVRSIDGGLANIKGLDEGTYTLTETQAPDNYTKLANPIQIKVEDKKDQNDELTGIAVVSVVNGSGDAKVIDKDGKETGQVESQGNGTIDISVYVLNAKGVSLPETGRTSALYCMAGGVALILLGGAYYLISNRRKSDEA